MTIINFFHSKEFSVGDQVKGDPVIGGITTPNMIGIVIQKVQKLVSNLGAPVKTETRYRVAFPVSSPFFHDFSCDEITLI